MAKIKIDLRIDSLLTTRTYENAFGEAYPFTENLSLNGKEYRIVIYDLPRVSKALYSSSDKTVIVESSTTFNGYNGEEILKAKEK